MTKSEVEPSLRNVKENTELYVKNVSKFEDRDCAVNNVISAVRFTEDRRLIHMIEF